MFGWYVHPAAIAAALAGLAILGPRALLARPGVFRDRVRKRDIRLLSHPHRPRAFLGDAAVSSRSSCRRCCWASPRRCWCRCLTRWRGARAASDEPLRAASGRPGARGWGFWDARGRSARTWSLPGSSRGSRPSRRGSRPAISSSSNRATRRTSTSSRCRWPTSTTARAGAQLAQTRQGAVRGVPGLGAVGIRRGLLHRRRRHGPALTGRRRRGRRERAFSDSGVPVAEKRLPTGVRHKEFDFGIYRFVAPSPAHARAAIDIGDQDDLQVVRFHAKERDARGTYRWTRALSYLSLIGCPPTRERWCSGWTTAAGPPRRRQPRSRSRLAR